MDLLHHSNYNQIVTKNIRSDFEAHSQLISFSIYLPRAFQQLSLLCENSTQRAN